MQDQNTINFTDGKRINLNLLKNQIDRRILKLTSMVSNINDSIHISKQNSYPKQYCNTFIQTTSLNDKNLTKTMENPLSQLTSNQTYAHDLKSIKNKYMKQFDQSSYLILRQSFEINQQKSFKTSKGLESKQLSCNQSKQLCKELNLDLSSIKFDDNISYQQQANQIKNYIRTTFSNRKKKGETQRPKLQYQQKTRTQRQMAKTYINDFGKSKVNEIPYINISTNCKQKIQTQIDKLSKEKRVYQLDNKIRSNLLKKIEQIFKNDIL